MSSSLLTRDVAVERLADKLAEETITQLFPGYPPDDIRRLLRGTILQIATSDRPPSVLGTLPGNAGLRCRLFTDGASRGNPGHAGAGIVLVDSTGQELLARGSYLGRMTNNAAEYRALLLGLDAALSIGCREISIFLDSELIVRQIEGRYKVKNDTLIPLYQEVRSRLAKFARWDIRHVPRAENTRADEMANRGIDERHQGR